MGAGLEDEPLAPCETAVDDHGIGVRSPERRHRPQRELRIDPRISSSVASCTSSFDAPRASRSFGMSSRLDAGRAPGDVPPASAPSASSRRRPEPGRARPPTPLSRSAGIYAAGRGPTRAGPTLRAVGRGRTGTTKPDRPQGFAQLDQDTMFRGRCLSCVMTGYRQRWQASARIPSCGSAPGHIGRRAGFQPPPAGIPLGEPRGAAARLRRPTRSFKIRGGRGPAHHRTSVPGRLPPACRDLCVPAPVLWACAAFTSGAVSGSN